jgi:hypothetical protein
METNQERMKANHEKMDAKIDANNEKFEDLRGTLVSRMDNHQTTTVPLKKESKPRWIYMKRTWRVQYTPSGPS